MGKSARRRRAAQQQQRSQLQPYQVPVQSEPELLQPQKVNKSNWKNILKYGTAFAGTAAAIAAAGHWLTKPDILEEAHLDYGPAIRYQRLKEEKRQAFDDARKRYDDWTRGKSFYGAKLIGPITEDDWEDRVETYQRTLQAYNDILFP